MSGKFSTVPYQLELHKNNLRLNPPPSLTLACPPSLLYPSPHAPPALPAGTPPLLPRLMRLRLSLPEWSSARTPSELGASFMALVPLIRVRAGSAHSGSAHSGHLHTPQYTTSLVNAISVPI